ncbi:MAG: hypothetical protein RLZZ594_144 [Actinomycetota bacterium]
MSKRFAVLGSPISHSKSPAIHLAAYRVLGLDWEYGRAEVSRGGLRKFIDELDGHWDCFSVTMPLKEDATRFADLHDEPSTLTKATNTLVIDEFGKWHGYNTDIFGLIQALAKTLPALPKHVLVIGSGATAVSAITAVSQFAPKAHIQVFARNPEARDAVIRYAKELGLRAGAAKRLKSATAKAHLTISTVPSGAMDEQAEALMGLRFWKPGGALMDVAYNPWPSKLAQSWQKHEQVVISGLEMLIWQAVAQIRLFYAADMAVELPNEVAVIEAMREAAQN